MQNYNELIDEQLSEMLMKTELNYVLLPTLFNACCQKYCSALLHLITAQRYCWQLYEQYGQQNNVQLCYTTDSKFSALYLVYYVVDLARMYEIASYLQ